MMRPMLILLMLVYSATLFAASNIPLSADKAFNLSLSLASSNQLVAEWHIAPGYYLYKDQIKFSVNAPRQDKINKILWPVAELRHDEIRGTYAVYNGTLHIPLMLEKIVQPNKVQVQINYQGCSQSGFCYPPISKTIAISNLLDSTATITPLWQNQQRVQVFLQSQPHLFFELLIFVGLGLMLAFTPCVLPMVPILSAIIIGQGKTLNNKKAAILSLLYVIGMSLTYAGAGLAAAWLGRSVQIFFQNPWVIGLTSVFFVLLALSFFDVYQFRLPTMLENNFQAIGRKQSGGTYFSVFLMGAFSSLIVSPCVSAPLVGVLAYIAQTGNRWYGGLSLFALGIGMGIPLLLVGVSAGKWLPKSGPWLETVKKCWGVVMLVMAVWMLARVVPDVLPTKQNFIAVQNLQQVQQQIHLAQHVGKPILIDFYADWCDSCVLMDKKVLHHPDVLKTLPKFVLLRVDVTQNTSADAELMKYFGVLAPPTILIFDRQGRELQNQRVVGEVGPQEFLARLTQVRL